MDNTLMTIIGIFLAAILMIVFPLMSVTERNDNIAQSVVQTSTTEFVDKISVSGMIKPSDYEAYVQKLASTGNTFDIEIEVQHLDENFGKKNGTTAKDLIGENQRYSTFTTEILDSMYLEDGTSQNYLLKKGDNVIVTVKNTNKTVAQTLKTFTYKVTGKGTYRISVTSSSMVVNDGGKSQYIQIGDSNDSIPEEPLSEDFYLYKDGNEYKSITGGWEPTIFSDFSTVDSTYFLAARYSKADGKLYFADELDYSHANGAFATVNKISYDKIKDYNTLRIKFKVTGSYVQDSYVTTYGRGNKVIVSLARTKPLFITYDEENPTSNTTYRVDGISGYTYQELKSVFGFGTGFTDPNYSTTYSKCENALKSYYHGAIWQSENKERLNTVPMDNEYDQANLNNYEKIGEELIGTVKLTEDVKNRIKEAGGCHILIFGYSHLNTIPTLKTEVYEVYLENSNPSIQDIEPGILITFDANGGTVSPTTKEVTYDSEYGTLPELTRTGYTFDGWYTATSGGDLITSSTKVTTASNHTLYAHWTANKYSVDLNVLVDNESEVRLQGVEGVYVDITMNGSTKSGVKDYWQDRCISHGSSLIMENIIVEETYKYEYIIIKQGEEERIIDDDLQTINEEKLRLEITDRTEIIIKVKSVTPEPDAIFIETDKNYKYYEDRYGEYKILSNCPDKTRSDGNGLSSNGKTQMALNCTFSLDKLIDKEQIIVGCTENSGWALRVNSNGNISFIIWDNESASKNYRLYEETNKIETNKIYNVTVIYDGNEGKVKLDVRNITDNEKRVKEFSTNISSLYQRDDMPTLIGENPIIRNNSEGSYNIKDHAVTEGDERSFYYPYNSEWERYETSTFDGKIYNVRLWYDQAFTDDEQLDIIYEEAKKMLADYENGSNLTNTKTGRPSNVPGSAYKFANNGNYYNIYTETVSWKEAKQKCEEMGGHLVTITSQEEQNFVKNNLLKDEPCWLGGTDEGHEGTWTWVTGEDFWQQNGYQGFARGYENWSRYNGVIDGFTQEPNNVNGNEHYLHMYLDGTWNDISEISKYNYYICEWEN